MKEENVKEEHNAKESDGAKEKKSVNNFFSKKETWIAGGVGLILGGLIVFLLGVFGVPGIGGNEAVVSFKGGKVSKNELYNDMTKKYSISYVLELADKEILEDMYTLTDKQNEEVNEQVESILSMYEAYGYDEASFLEENGFESKEDFINYLKLDYERNLYCIEYFKTLLNADDINNYYNDNVYGEINTKHILVKTSNDVTEEQALATANEILDKLKNGTSFDDVANEYQDKVTTENVDFDNFTEDSLEDAYVNASKGLEKDQYTTEPVKTTYGYHIIYCINKAEKPSFEDAENNIVELLAEDLEDEDQYIRYKALIKMREEKNLKFKNKDLEAKYKEYCDQVNPSTDSPSTDE